MTIRIGTRTSRLAIKQAEEVACLLNKFYPDIETHLVHINTTGDKLQTANLALEGGKGLFLKELEEQLINDKIDIAVHSLKDVPIFLPDGLEITCYLERENPYDALVSNKYESLAQLPLGAKVGTSALRRLVHLKQLRPDLNVVPFRGNVNTRLRKLDEGEVDACVLAYAGLKRVGLEGRIKQLFNLDEMIPAIGQGVICVQHRTQDARIGELLKPLNHIPTEQCITAERLFMANLSGSCTTPMGAYGQIEPVSDSGEESVMTLDAMYYDERSRKLLYAKSSAAVYDLVVIAEDCSKQIKQQLV